jgi:hypothetical protein
MRREFYLRKDHCVQADFFRVENDGVIFDDPLIPQTLYTAPTRRLRETDFLADRSSIDAGLSLQQLQNTAVCLIYVNFLHIL